LTSFGDKSAPKVTITDFQQSVFICFLFPVTNADTGQNSTLIYTMVIQKNWYLTIWPELLLFAQRSQIISFDKI